jgi:DNA-binding transcriptional LysR family regulator
MNSLEAELGFPILQRGHFGIKLTPEGERVFPKIRQLVMAEDSFMNEVELIKSYGDNVIRIGCFDSIANTWMPELIAMLEEEFPEVTFNIQTGTVAELYGGLDEGRYDICFGTKNAKYNFKWIVLSKDPFRAILPQSYPISRETFPLEAFNGTKFLMPGLGFDDDISAVFDQYNLHPFVTQTYVDDPAIISMVEHGQGISMLSELIVENTPNHARIVPIVPEVFRTIAIAYKEDKILTIAMKRMISMARKLYSKPF